jgi:uncharacterized membrane protein
MKATSRKFARHVSVPSGKGIRVDKTITISLPPEQVYSFWRRLENLPQFMTHIESVTEKDSEHSHWVVKGAGKTLEWDAEIIEDEPNRMISWRSLPDADVDNAGSVWFTPARSGMGTKVKVSLKYLPPAGKLGAVVAKVFGQDAKSEIEEDLGRVKTLLERQSTGAATSMTQPRSRRLER